MMDLESVHLMRESLHLLHISPPPSERSTR
jgi:hypothetical protein